MQRAEQLQKWPLRWLELRPRRRRRGPQKVQGKVRVLGACLRCPRTRSIARPEWVKSLHKDLEIRHSRIGSLWGDRVRLSFQKNGPHWAFYTRFVAVGDRSLGEQLGSIALPMVYSKKRSDPLGNAPPWGACACPFPHRPRRGCGGCVPKPPWRCGRLGGASTIEKWRLQAFACHKITTFRSTKYTFGLHSRVRVQEGSFLCTS